MHGSRVFGRRVWVVGGGGARQNGTGHVDWQYQKTLPWITQGLVGVA